MEGMVMSFDAVSYIIGYESGKDVQIVEVTGDITCTDDGEANITITEGE
jgi:hypothetical protein